MDVESSSQIQFWATQGGFALSFLVIFWFYRKDMKGQKEGLETQMAILMQVVKDCTASHVHLSGVIEALHRRLDIDSDVRIRRRGSHVN